MAILRLNATLSGAKTSVKNEDHFESQALSEMFVAKYPGVLGNSIAVSAFAIQSGESATSSVTNSLWSWLGIRRSVRRNSRNFWMGI